MGNILSAVSTGGRSVISSSSITTQSRAMDDIGVFHNNTESENVGEQFHDTIDDDEEQNRTKNKEDEMAEFKKQLSLKREQRKEILARHRSEKEKLQISVEEERKSKLELIERNRFLQQLLLQNKIEIPGHTKSAESDLFGVINQMKEEFETLKSNNNKLRCDLANTNNALQAAYSDMADLSAQNTESIKQINALKEVIAVSKTMINLREQQLNQLKNKLNEIEHSLADRETNILSVDLRQEYERQLQNIRTLRGLYEERARLAESTRQALVRELEEQKLLKQAEITKCKSLAEHIDELESKVNSLESVIEDKNNQIATCEEETRGIKAEMKVVNKLFSQVLLGYKSKKDLDQLVQRLEENHGLLTHMAEKENGSEASSAMPKLLLELINQVDEKENDDIEIEQPTQKSDTEDNQGKPLSETDANTLNTKAEEIVQNLPKVWRVLMELLSQQSEADTNMAEKVTTCYKSVETKTGPVLVPSVSQTYIRLKDLIIEKLSLIKEVNRMKQLNTHLESRLGEQERRLCLVTTELSKTWHVVGRLRRHHHQLHTHEKILKYELQQKRKLLNELKEELEYCREKWDQAREKNTQSERDWRKLRTEFSNRKIKPGSASLNNSAESGYSDERASEESSESNDESEYITESKARCKKKLKKSFETVLDSSADFNLIAEREDPASDLLDVADLPLDTQDDVLENYDISECNSENIPKSDKMCGETEDEISNDSCVEDTPLEYDCQKSEKVIEEVNSSSSISKPSPDVALAIDPEAILKSIREQNERLARKDKKLESLEKDGLALLKKTQTIAKYSDQINNTLDHLINRPTTSRQFQLSEQNFTNDHDHDQSKNNNVLTTNGSLITHTNNETIFVTLKNQEETKENINPDKNHTEITHTSKTDEENVFKNSKCSAEKELENKPSCSSTSKVTDIDLKTVLENVNRQKDLLEKKDQRLKDLENGCSSVLHNLSEIIVVGDEMISKLESIHTERGEEFDVSFEEQRNSQDNMSAESASGLEPSLLNETDHEARFAARDLRLKRLEEQTKSLVNKVNKTATKGVKINYKLEELHNIYGSDQSRSGTPSEESEDISQGKEDKETEETND